MPCISVAAAAKGDRAGHGGNAAGDLTPPWYGAGAEEKVQYCRTMLQAVLAWGTPAEALLRAAAQGDYDVQEQLVDCCRCVLGLAPRGRCVRC